MKKGKILELPAFDIRADFNPQTLDDENRTVEIVFSTGAKVLKRSWEGDYMEELSLEPGAVRLERLNESGPLLNAHSSWAVEDQIGAVVPGSAKIEDATRHGEKCKEARVVIRFSKREAVDPIWGDVRDGILKNVSVGYRVHKFEETTEEEGSLPLRKAVDWEPFEVSMVPMGADLGAQVRGEERGQKNRCVIVTRVTGEEAMTKEEKDKLAADKVAADKLAAEKLAAEGTGSGNVIAPAGNETAAAEATKQERQRVLDIQSAVKAAGLERSVADDYVEKGTAIDVVRKEVLEKRAAKDDENGTIGVIPGEDASDKWRTGTTAWLIQKAGLTDAVRKVAKEHPDHPVFRDIALDPGEMRGLTLLELAKESLQRAGVETRGKDKLEIAGLALRAAGIMGGQSTSDFAVALESVLHKTLLSAYLLRPDTWRGFCAVGTVTDFRPHSRYRSGWLGRLDIVREGGEFNNKALPDASKETITAVTKGNILALNRQTLINDDMGLFTRVATQIGRAAALSIELDVYDLIKLNSGMGPEMNDGDVLFHTNHSNIGGGAAISVVALDADRVVMATQTDASGNEVLDLRPSILVCPIGIGGVAKVINKAQFDPDTANKLQRPNMVVGLFDDIVDTPHLTGTRRYLFADPLMMPVIEVAFLDGGQEPFLQWQEGWRIDGIEWKIRLDYAVGAIEVRGAVTDAGA